MLAAVCAIAFLFIYSAGRYSFQSGSLLNTACYLASYLVLPVLVILGGRKYPVLRWYIICAMSGVILCSGVMLYRNAETVREDLSDYLEGDSEFIQIAADLLPDADALAAGQDVDYCHRKKNSGFEMIELYARFDAETYREIASNGAVILENTVSSAEILSVNTKGTIFVEGHTYSCTLISTKNGCYAAACCYCDDCNSVSWLFFTDDALSYMSIADALDLVRA